MTYSVICTINNNQVIITLPPDFSKRKQVTVVVDDHVDTKAQKLEQLKIASVDPLFLADIKDVHLNFDAIDYETL